MLANYVNQVNVIWKHANSEAKLEGELNNLLRDLLINYGVDYDPKVNQTITTYGSQMNSLRPDSMFGHVILDYKKPGSLLNPRKLDVYQRQVTSYLDYVNNGGHLASEHQCQRWAGILWDGQSICFCRSDGTKWKWSPLYPNSESSLRILAQCYRALKRRPLTGELLTQHFGNGSDMADRVITTLFRHLSNPTAKTKMLLREWNRLFEQVSTYELSQLPSLEEWAICHNLDSPDASKIIFCMHTYYSIIVKLLAAELLIANLYGAPNMSIVQQILSSKNTKHILACFKRLEQGAMFRELGITNFLEGDFFSWYIEEFDNELASCVKEVAVTLNEFEPATGKLMPEYIRDLLKEFYSGLVNDQIRHDLGEFYTPNWLAEYLLDSIGYYGGQEITILDPTCGSGTFLVECIKRLKEQCIKDNVSSRDTLKIVLKNIRGMDLNPLAVISARTNYILAISDLIDSLRGEKIEIPVYLADSINIPVEKENLFEYTLETEQGNINLRFPSSIVRAQLLGNLLLKCEDFIEEEREPQHAAQMLRSDPELEPYLDDKALGYIMEFYTEIYKLHTRRPSWNGIWCRVVKNNYSPSGFEKFDMIVGNPPWVRWSRLPVNYRERVKSFCNHYGLVSGRGFTGGIESDIATVITFSAADNWLKIGGKIGFLITRTVFKTASATGFRKGTLPDISKLKLIQMEDMSEVQLFSDANNETALYIAEKVVTAEEYTSAPCKVWKPILGNRIPSSLSVVEALSRVKREEVEAIQISETPGSPYFIGSREKYNRIVSLRGQSTYYLKKAHRGTVTDFARVYWLKVKSYSPETNRALICTLTERELPRAQKIPQTFGTWIEADLLHPLMRGRDAGRYCWNTQGWYQLIPNDHYSLIDSEQNFASQYPLAYHYFCRFKPQLLKRSSYKRYQKNSPFYSIFCIGDYSFAQYKVVWPELQNPNNFRAAAVTTKTGVLPNNVVVPDHKLYYVSVDSEIEAHYVASILNSRPVRQLFGGVLLSKNIGVSIFEYLNVPPYDNNNNLHRMIAQIGKKAATARGLSLKKGLLSSDLESKLEELVFSAFSQK